MGFWEQLLQQFAPIDEPENNPYTGLPKAPTMPSPNPTGLQPRMTPDPVPLRGSVLGASAPPVPRMKNPAIEQAEQELAAAQNPGPMTGLEKLAFVGSHISAMDPAQMAQIQQNRLGMQLQAQRDRESRAQQQLQNARQAEYQNSQLEETRRLRTTQEAAETRKGQMADMSNAVSLRKAGLRAKKDPISGDLTSEFEAIPRSELTPEEIADLDMKESGPALKKAQAELAQANAEYKKFQSDPNNPQFELARRRLEVAQQNARTATQRLGLSERALELSEERMNNQPLSVDDKQVLSGMDTSIKMINDIIPQIHEISGTMGPVWGRVKLAEIEKAGGLGATEKEIAAALDMRRLLMSEAFSSGGKQLTPTERAEFEALLPALSDTVDQALIKAEQAQEFLREKKQARMKYLTPRQQKVYGDNPTPPKPTATPAATPAAKPKVIQYDSKGNRIP